MSRLSPGDELQRGGQKIAYRAAYSQQEHAPGRGGSRNQAVCEKYAKVSIDRRRQGILSGSAYDPGESRKRQANRTTRGKTGSLTIGFTTTTIVSGSIGGMRLIVLAR